MLGRGISAAAYQARCTTKPASKEVDSSIVQQAQMKLAICLHDSVPLIWARGPTMLIEVDGVTKLLLHAGRRWKLHKVVGLSAISAFTFHARLAFPHELLLPEMEYTCREKPLLERPSPQGERVFCPSAIDQRAGERETAPMATQSMTYKHARL